MPNILLTSVGRRVELVRAFRSVYTEFGLPGRIFATDVDWLAPAMQFVDSAHLVPQHRFSEFIRRLSSSAKT